MTDLSERQRFSEQSLRVHERVPSTTVLQDSSRRLGWNSILVDKFVSHGNREEEVTSLPSPDVRITVALAGSYDLWVLRNGRWFSGLFHQGLVNVLGAGESRELRWRNRNANSAFHVASAYLSPAILEEAAEHFSRPGYKLDHRVPNSMVFNDAVIAGTVNAMVDALSRDACELFAEQGTRWLAAHIIHANSKSFVPSDDERKIGRITDTRLSRVLEYMRVNLSKQMSITELANVAAVSPFHFCRLFSGAVGMPPNRYLTERRMQKAEALLRTSNISLGEVAGLCGYTRPNAFSIAFQRYSGSTPTSYRRAARA